MSASEHEHFSLYKSKSGNHSTGLGARERLLNERKINRTKSRLDAFTEQRKIEQTPLKPNPNQNKRKSIEISTKLSRQQAYAQRFVEYRAKREERKKNVQKPKPFVSSVPTGRMIESVKSTAITAQRPIDNRITALRPIKIDENFATKKTIKKQISYSPINTRSKNGQLLPPMKSLTPKRKKRLENTEAKKTTICAIPPTKDTKKSSTVVGSIPTAKVQPMIKRTVIPKRSTNAGISAKTISSIVLSKKPTVASATTTSAKQSTKTLEPKGFHFTNFVQVPSKFDFNHVEKATTSTAMKLSTTKLAKSNARASKKLFEESFSPIEIENSIKTPQSSTSSKPRKSIAKEIAKIENEEVQIKAEKQNDKIVTKKEQPSNATPKNGPHPSTSGINRRKSLTKIDKKMINEIKMAANVKKEMVKNVDANDNDSSKYENDLNVTPTNTCPLNDSCNYLSPFVTVSRGKIRSKKQEFEAREAKYKLESRKSIDLNTSAEDRQNKEAALYFRMQIKRETDHLMELVDKWQTIKNVDNATIPTEHIDLIDLAIGQTRLLITNKFEQFRGLVDKCDCCDTTNPVRPEDLEGFWTMIYIQVENCEKRFDRLNKLKANDWREPDLMPSKIKKLRTTDSSIAKKKNKSIRKGNSALEKMLKEARKRHREEGRTNNNADVLFTLGKQKPLLTPNNRLSDSGVRVSGTPKRSIWIVEEQSELLCPYVTPQRGILKTPGSMRKSRNVLFMNGSPQVRLYDKEN